MILVLLIVWDSFSVSSLQCKYLSIIIYKDFVSHWFLLNLLNLVWMCVSVLREENDCSVSYYLITVFSFLLLLFLHLFYFFPFYLVDQSNFLLSYLLCFSDSYINTYSGIRMAQLGGKKMKIIYKWPGRSASGSDGWPHWASLLFSFQSICYWYKFAFKIYIFLLCKVDCVDYWL